MGGVGTDQCEYNSDNSFLLILVILKRCKSRELACLNKGLFVDHVGQIFKFGVKHQYIVLFLCSKIGIMDKIALLDLRLTAHDNRLVQCIDDDFLYMM